MISISGLASKVPCRHNMVTLLFHVALSSHGTAKSGGNRIRGRVKDEIFDRAKEIVECFAVFVLGIILFRGKRYDQTVPLEENSMIKVISSDSGALATEEIHFSLAQESYEATVIRFLWFSCSSRRLLAASSINLFTTLWKGVYALKESNLRESNVEIRFECILCFIFVLYWSAVRGKLSVVYFKLQVRKYGTVFSCYRLTS